MEITEFTSRTAVADLDCLAICPAYPDFLIYGTYSIIKRGEGQEYSAQVRSGSLQTLSASPTFEPAYAGMLPPKLAQHKFSAAVLDIRFHPSDTSLLGVALSNGTIHFFRFVKRADVLGRCVITELFPLGHAEASAADIDTGIIPLVTQFQWFSSLQEVGRRDVSNTLTVTLAATLSSGEVKILKTKIPGIKSTHDHRLALPPVPLEAITDDVHSHGLEAWCTSILAHPSPDTYIILSGGDDSTLVGSIVSLLASSRVDDNIFADAPAQLIKDSKTHAAGVTAILPLPLAHSNHPTNIPLLTGSYDETLRLLTINPSLPKRPIEHSSLSLRGGVWRLQIMDHYSIVLPPSRAGILSPGSEPKRHEQHYIILASCMHAGAKIIRVTHSPVDLTGIAEWQMHIEASFTKGHDTLVYACDFRREWRGDVVIGLSPKSKKVLGVTGKDVMNNNKRKGMVGDDVGRYTVVSTGFYDRQICTWEWRDERRREGEC